VVLDLKKEQILVRKPKSDLKEMFGAWSDMSSEDVKEIKAIWRGWNEKDFHRL